MEKVLGSVSGTSHYHRTKWKHLPRELGLNSSTHGDVSIDSAYADDSLFGKVSLLIYDWGLDQAGTLYSLHSLRKRLISCLQHDLYVH